MSAWQPPERSAQAQAIHAAAEADRRRNPDAYRLDADALLAAALQGAPLAALGPDDWSEGLDGFLRSAREEADLNAVGLRMAGGTAIGRLRARLAMRRFFDDHPQRRARSIEAPVFIVGGWRTGTTFLQRMLARVPVLRALHPWELGAPWKAAGARGDARERLIAAAQRAHDQLHVMNAQLQRVHDSGAELPEECVLAMGSDFRNWGFLSTLRLPGYAEWLAGQDFSGAYALHRDVLRILDEADGRRFLLKAPAHVGELASLLSAFPDATVVHLHRDVVETVASGSSLFAVFRSTYSDRVDPADVGAFQTWQTGLWLDRALDFRARCQAEGRGRFVDVAYRELVRDPLATAHAICTAAGISWTPEIEIALTDHAAAHRQHGHGPHRYSPEEFGLEPDALRERFSAYRERFGVT